MKKLIALIIALCLLTGCALTEEFAGGWSVNTEASLPAEAVEALNAAASGIDELVFEPVCLLGTQLVAGMNYAILCRISDSEQDGGVSWAVAYVYADLDGGAELSLIDPIMLGLDYYDYEETNDLVIISSRLSYENQLDFSWYEDGTQEEMYMLCDGLVFVDVLRTPYSDDGSFAGYSKTEFLYERYGELRDLSLSEYDGIQGCIADRFTFTAGGNEDTNCCDAVFFTAGDWNFHVCVIIDADAYNGYTDYSAEELHSLADNLYTSIELVIAMG